MLPLRIPILPLKENFFCSQFLTNNFSRCVSNSFCGDKVGKMCNKSSGFHFSVAVTYNPVGITVHIITRLLNVLQRVTVAESASCLHREITHLLL